MAFLVATFCSDPMISERTEKLLLLVSAIVSALVAIVGGATDLFKKLAALAVDIRGTPPLIFGLIYSAFFALSIWLIIKWRSRSSKLLKPDAFRLDRDNVDHLVGRTDDTEILLQQCLFKQITFLEGESGSGKSALIRSGLLPRLKGSDLIVPLLLPDLWVDQWERGPMQALMIALRNNASLGQSSDLNDKKSNLFASSTDIENWLASLHDLRAKTALIIFDQFDDYQARNRDRFLKQKTWIDPTTLRRQNRFWEMIARLLEAEKVKCLFVTRSDTAGGFSSVQFLGPVEALRLDRVPTPYIAELINSITRGKPDAPVIAEPEAGWNKLQERIVRDVSQQDVVLPQQLNTMLRGIQGLKSLSVAEYDKAGGASGIEALYVERQIAGAARKSGLESSLILPMLVDLIDPINASKTRSRSKALLAKKCNAVHEDTKTLAKLEVVLTELERGELIRAESDPDKNTEVYRLDHDYLTRGVAAAERRANKWRYVLEDGSKSFENAGTSANRWRALLPASVQVRLAWERLRGNVRYGQQQLYALASLLRLVPLAAVLVATAVGIFQIKHFRYEEAVRKRAQEIWVKFEFIDGISDQERDAAWMLASEPDPNVRLEFVRQMMTTPEYAVRLLRSPELVTQALVPTNLIARRKLEPTVVEFLKNKQRYGVIEIGTISIARQLGNPVPLDTGALVEATITADNNQVPVLQEAFDTFVKQVGAQNPAFLMQQIVNAITLKSSLGSSLNRMFDSLSLLISEQDSERLEAQVISSVLAVTDGDQLTSLRVFARTLTPKLTSQEFLKSQAIRAINGVNSTLDYDQHRALEEVLELLKSQLTPINSSSLIESIMSALSQTNEVYKLGTLSRMLSVAGLPAHIADARALALAVIDGLRVGETNKALFSDLEIVRPLLSEDGAYTVAESAISAIDQEGTTYIKQNLQKGFSLIIPSLNSAAVRKLADSNLAAINETQDYWTVAVLADSVIALSLRLSTDELAIMAKSLVEAAKSHDGYQRDGYAKILASVYAHLEESGKASVESNIIRTAETASDRDRLLFLLSIAQQLDENNVRWLTKPLTDLMQTNGDAVGLLMDAFLVVGRSLSDRDREVLADSISRNIYRAANSNSYLRPYVIANIVDRSFVKRDKISGAAAYFLTRSLPTIRSDYESFRRAADISEVISPHLTPEAAAALNKAIVESFSRAQGTAQCSLLSRAIAALAPVLDETEAHAQAISAVTLIRGRDRSDQATGLADAFSKLAPRMRASDVKDTIYSLYKLMSETKQWWQIGALAQATVTVAPNMDVEVARQFSEKLLGLIDEQPNTPLATLLVAVDRKLPWNERLRSLATALKSPNVYGSSRTMIVEAIAENPDARRISGKIDTWSIAQWLQTDNAIDMESPLQGKQSSERTYRPLH
ncbi:nSTAND1 domain-containing NTPase [Bradyrhizobium commune]|uniref:Novel STAND NTPase 1 domain-containing protein n=1 Tax=Bradyrhizobium commune TaxID=83627 RepID=A0A7S9D395_9BRAD|nr:hypothetical protein [Bradyrhizobium commune]QPF89659.1 hypothetical protein IC761_24530 [Bradyrhizobium commune]